MRVTSNRILIVDDNEAIHEDFIKILNPPRTLGNQQSLNQIEMALFEDEEIEPIRDLDTISYRIDSAYQGKQAVEMTDDAAKEGEPYSVVFMDVRMPPGMNGVEAIKKIWEKHPFIEMVIVTAYSDYSWEEILRRIGMTDRLMFLRKPFDQVSVKQLGLALTKKYNLSVKVQNYIENIESEIFARNNQLENMVKELKNLGMFSE